MKFGVAKGSNSADIWWTEIDSLTTKDAGVYR